MKDTNNKYLMNFLNNPKNYMSAKPKVSTLGYKANSPDINEPALTIPSNRITMQNVNFPVQGTDNLGNTQMMYPGQEYQYPGDYVTEQPILNNQNINNMNNQSFQQGGNYLPYYNIYQEGGPTEEDVAAMQQPQEQGELSEQQLQQVAQQVIQALTQGQQPEQIMQQLVQAGIPQQEAQEIIGIALVFMQQMQGQQQQQVPQQKYGGCAGCGKLRRRQDGGQEQDSMALYEQQKQQGGGEQEQQMQQLMQQVGQALQQGAKPDEVMQQLIQMGIPQEQAQQMIQSIMQQLQGGQ